MEENQFACPKCDYRVEIPEDSAAKAKLYAANLEHMLKHLRERTPRRQNNPNQA